MPGMHRPGNMSRTTTPTSDAVIRLLGGRTFDAVALTWDELRSIQRLYGYTAEPAGESRCMMQAGADRNAIRHAQEDGLRLVAWLASYLEPGEDPLRLLVRLVSRAGYDVGAEDFEWASSEEES